MTTNSLLLAIAITAIANAQFTENSEENEQEILASVVVEADGSVEDYVDPILDGSTIRRLPAHAQRAVIGNLFYRDGSSEAYYYPTDDADQTSRRLAQQHAGVTGNYATDPKEEVLKLAYLAYCDSTMITAWDCEWCNEVDGYAPIKVVSQSEQNGKYVWTSGGFHIDSGVGADLTPTWDPGYYSWTPTKKTVNTGYVAFNKDSNEIVIGFSVKAVTTNYLDASLNKISATDMFLEGEFDSPLAVYPTSLSGTSVHYTFWAWWTGEAAQSPPGLKGGKPQYTGLKGGLWHDITSLIMDNLSADVIVIGHGLGGVIAKFALLDIAPLMKKRKSTGKLIAYTFGEPKWCNAQMSKYFENTFLSKHEFVTSLRVSFGSDIVSVYAPAIAFGNYVHVNPLTWTDYSGKSYVCPNGEKDADCQPKTASMRDHYAYYGLQHNRLPYGYPLDQYLVCEGKKEYMDMKL